MIHRQFNTQIGQSLFAQFHIGTNATTIAYLPAVTRMEHRGKTVRNSRHRTVFITMGIIYGLNAATAGDIIFGCGHFEQTRSRHFARSLHQTFTITTLAHYHGAIQILQSTGHNFGRRSRASTNQHHQRHLRVHCLATRFIMTIIALGFSSRRNNLFTFIYKQITDRNRLRHQTASVLAQIEHQTSSSLFFQIEQSLFYLLRCLVGEAFQIDIANLFGHHTIIYYLWHHNLLTSKSKLDRFLHALTTHFQYYLRIRPSAQLIAHIRYIFTSNIFAIYRKNFVAKQQTGFLRRHIFIRFADIDFSIALRDDSANTGIFSGGHIFKIGNFFFGNIRGIRIENGQHSPDARLKNLVHIYTIDIISIQIAEHIVQHVEIFCNFVLTVFGSRCIHR